MASWPCCVRFTPSGAFPRCESTTANPRFGISGTYCHSPRESLSVLPKRSTQSPDSVPNQDPPNSYPVPWTRRQTQNQHCHDQEGPLDHHYLERRFPVPKRKHPQRPPPLPLLPQHTPFLALLLRRQRILKNMPVPLNHAHLPSQRHLILPYPSSNGAQLHHATKP